MVLRSGGRGIRILCFFSSAEKLAKEEPPRAPAAVCLLAGRPRCSQPGPEARGEDWAPSSPSEWAAGWPFEEVVSVVNKSELNCLVCGALFCVGVVVD